MTTMPQSYSLLEFLLELLGNDELREDFNDDPEGTLAEHGLDDLSPLDCHDALVLIEDNQTTDFDRTYGTVSGSVGSSPPPVHHGDDHDAAVTYLKKYVTDNYVDDHPVKPGVSPDGGDLDQDIDLASLLASGDGGADATAGKLDLHGVADLVGTGNQAVTGVGDTASFGDGADIAAAVRTGTSSAFATGGDAAVDSVAGPATDSDTGITTDPFETDIDIDIDAGVHGSGGDGPTDPVEIPVEVETVDSVDTSGIALG